LKLPQNINLGVIIFNSEHKIGFRKTNLWALVFNTFCTVWVK